MSYLLRSPCLFCLPYPKSSQLAARLRQLDAYKLIALKVTGTARYTDKEILAASGLQIGQNAADGDFKEAAQRLGDSGLFSDVAYSYSFSDAGVKARISACRYRQRASSFPRTSKTLSGSRTTNSSPPCGAVFRYLNSCCRLRANCRIAFPKRCRRSSARSNLPGRVDFLREGDESGGPLNGDRLPGRRSQHTDSQCRIPRSFTRADSSAHNRGCPPFGSRIQPLYPRRRRTIRFSSGVSAARIFKGDLRPVRCSGRARKPPQRQQRMRKRPRRADIEVDAIVPVTPGKIYSISSVEWKGNSAIATGELAPLLHLPSASPPMPCAFSMT